MRIALAAMASQLRMDQHRASRIAERRSDAWPCPKPGAEEVWEGRLRVQRDFRSTPVL